MKTYIGCWRDYFNKTAPAAVLWHFARFCGYLAGVYLLLAALILLAQRQLIYYPTQNWLGNPAMPVSVVTYKTDDGISLRGWYAPPAPGMPVIVMFHGNGGNISYRGFKQDYFLRRGYGFLLAEYRGYSGNAGSPAEEGLYLDARAAMTWLTDAQHIARGDIIIYGESVGTGVAVQMASEYGDARALVLEAPFTSLTAVAGDVYPWFRPLTVFVRDKYDSLRKIRDIRMPLLIVNGSDDEIIPARHGGALFKASASPKKRLVTISGGRHNDLADYSLLQDMEKFLGELAVK